MIHYRVFLELRVGRVYFSLHESRYFEVHFFESGVLFNEFYGLIEVDHWHIIVLDV